MTLNFKQPLKPQLDKLEQEAIQAGHPWDVIDVLYQAITERLDKADIELLINKINKYGYKKSTS